MNIPGGDELIEAVTKLIFEYWENIRGARQGGTPVKWENLPEHFKREWIIPQRTAAEFIIVALIQDQLVAMDDGSDAGAARARAVTRYCHEELNHKMPIHQPNGEF